MGSILILSVGSGAVPSGIVTASVDPAVVALVTYLRGLGIEAHGYVANATLPFPQGHHFLADVSALVEALQPVVVGISVSYLGGIRQAELLASHLHKISPEIVVVAGGGVVTGLMYEGLHHRWLPNVDICIPGDGEHRLRDIAQAPQNWTSRGVEADLQQCPEAELPPLRYDGLLSSTSIPGSPEPIETSWDPAHVCFEVITTRSCPYQCPF